MINLIIETLKENPKVSDYLILEAKVVSKQAFYVLQKLESRRVQKTKEYSITVYHKYQSEGQEYLGSSTFQISQELKKSELQEKIEDAVFAASFSKNKVFNLVKGKGKKTWKDQDFQFEAFELIDKIANIFFSEASKNAKFNSLEIFATQTTNTLINSQGVDYQKTLNKLYVEAIPSYDGLEDKVELYQYYTYQKLDFEAIKEDAIQALKDVETRYTAKKSTENKKIDVILKDQEVMNFFSELISDYAYHSIYKQNTDKKIGDLIQKEAEKDLLSISLIPSSEADAFDRDGVILKPVRIIEKGKLISYYGDNQYAEYLGLEPTGQMRKLKVETGKESIQDLKKQPHLEIVSLSGIQIDTYANYIGGEVRLALYFDGKDYYPISGFSFSGNIDNSLKTIMLSQEETDINNYQGPKYLLLKEMEII